LSNPVNRQTDKQTDAGENITSFANVCLLTGLLKTTNHIFMKFYGMVGHNTGTGTVDWILSDLDWLTPGQGH